MKYISICSGIEAATTAWHGLGWEPLAFSEIDAFPSAVLAERYPKVPNLGDMSNYREWPEELLAECELLVGGTPCQAFSVAGLRKSLDDERGNLSLIYVHLFHHINEIRRRHGRSPAIALWENVPGVLSTKDNAFGCFISGLLGVDDTIEVEGGKWPKAGFLGSETVRVGYRVLDAQYFAVAQRRRRVFLVAVPCELVASLGERACPSEILSLRESVLGNPPARGEARQEVAGGAAGCAASGGEPYHLDRAMFNQGVNAQYDPQITDNGVASSMVARGPAAVAFGGNRTGGPVDVATSCLANGSPHGRMDFASETFVVQGEEAVAFKPGQSEAAGGTFVTEEFAPTIQAQNNGSTAVPAVAFKPSHYTRGKDGKPDEVAPPLSADADKGDQDTLVMRQSIGFNWQNGVGYGDANDALGITEEGTGPLSRSQVPAVAFSAKDSGSDATEECSPTMRATQHVDGNANAGGQIAVAFTKAKRAQSKNDDESWVPGEVAPTQNQFDVGDTRATTVVAIQERAICENPDAGPDGAGVRSDGVSYTLEARTAPQAVAFTQNSRDEVRKINGDGQIAGSLSAEGGMHQTNYIAFANRTRDGVKVPEVMKDGVVPALTNPGQGGRSDAVNVVAEGPVQVQWASGGGKVENPTMQALRTSAEHSYQFIRNAMQVRRLTPTECCRLQGFPDDHCDIVYRKKPAADGPKYRALGNSMAVPCMAWLGWRIHQATGRAK